MTIRRHFPASRRLYAGTRSTLIRIRWFLNQEASDVVTGLALAGTLTALAIACAPIVERVQ